MTPPAARANAEKPDGDIEKESVDKNCYILENGELHLQIHLKELSFTNLGLPPACNPKTE